METDDQSIKTFLENLKLIKANKFASYLSWPIEEGDDLTLIEAIESLTKTMRYFPTKKDTKIKLSDQEQLDFVKEFYRFYFPKNFSKRIDDVFDRKDPLFTEKNGKKNRYNLIIKHVNDDDKYFSSISHNQDDTSLIFTLFLHGNIDDLRTIAHESIHAMSAHHRKSVEAVRNFASPDEIKELHSLNFDKDCIGEIESHIIEHLFNRFLLHTKIYNQHDMTNYKNCEHNSLVNNLHFIVDENKIAKLFGKDSDEKKAKTVIIKLQKEKKSYILDCIDNIRSMKYTSEKAFYKYRYVVGRIIADKWIENFDKSNKIERQNMIKDFISFVDHTDTMTPDKASEKLLGYNFYDAIEDFVLNLVNESKSKINIGDELF